MSIYNNIYNLLVTYVYGGAVVTGSFEELTAILFSTLACLCLVALPFVLIFKFIMRWI